MNAMSLFGGPDGIRRKIAQEIVRRATAKGKMVTDLAALDLDPTLVGAIVNGKSEDIAPRVTPELMKKIAFPLRISMGEVLGEPTLSPAQEKEWARELSSQMITAGCPVDGVPNRDQRNIAPLSLKMKIVVRATAEFLRSQVA